MKILLYIPMLSFKIYHSSENSENSTDKNQILIFKIAEEFQVEERRAKIYNTKMSADSIRKMAPRMSPTRQALTQQIDSYKKLKQKYNERRQKSIKQQESAITEQESAKTPEYDVPQYEEPQYEEPQYEVPAIEQEPMQQEPEYEEPVQKPEYEEPVQQEPVYEEPVQEPMQQEPVQQEPVYEEPAKTFAQEEPVQEMQNAAILPEKIPEQQNVRFESIERLQSDLIKKAEIMEKHIADNIINEKINLAMQKQEELWKEKERLLRSEIESLRSEMARTQNVQNTKRSSESVRLRWDERRRSRSPKRREDFELYSSHKYALANERALMHLSSEIHENEKTGKYVDYRSIRNVFSEEPEEDVYTILRIINRTKIHSMNMNVLAKIEFLSIHMNINSLLDRALSALTLKDVIRFYRSKPRRITSTVVVRATTQRVFNVELFEALISKTFKQKTITKTILLQYCANKKWDHLDFRNSEGKITTISISNIMRAIDCYYDSLFSRNYNIYDHSLSIETLELYASLHYALRNARS